MGDELLLNFGLDISALIYNFIREITKLPWQTYHTCEDGGKTDSIGNFVENYENYELKTKFKF